MLEKLRKYCQEHQGPGNATIVVGYSQSYALEVHERTDVHHKVGQAKYLETAARESEPEIVRSIRKASVKDLPEVMLKAALLIQRRSQELVPVDTSALKASAFVSKEEDLDKTASDAKTKAEMIRMSVLTKREAKGKKK